MTEEEQRRHVVEIARTWIRTPFHDNGDLKGIGVDCARFIAHVYAEAGLIPQQEIAQYSPQWMLHSDTPLFEEYVRRFGHQVDTPGVGDIVLYRVGRSFAHGAIAVDWPGAIIHAFKTFGFVAETDSDEAELRGRPRKFFSLW